MKWAAAPFASQSRRTASPALASMSTIMTSQPRAASPIATDPAEPRAGTGHDSGDPAPHFPPVGSAAVC